MSISEDTSNQPGVVSTAGNWKTTPLVTGAFTPPGSRLLLAFAQGGNSSTNTNISATITDSVGGTWQQLVRVQSFALGQTCEVWARWVATSPGSMTVTSTASSDGTVSGGALLVRDLINSSDTQPGFVGSEVHDTVALMQLQVDCGFSNKIYGISNNWTDSTAMTALSNTTAMTAVVDSFNADNWGTFKSSADTNGNDVWGYSSSKQGLIAAVEILDPTPIGEGDATPPPPMF